MKIDYSQIQYEHFTKTSYITGSSVDRRRHQGNYPQTLDNPPVTHTTSADSHKKNHSQISQCKKPPDNICIYLLIFMRNMDARAAKKATKKGQYL